MKDRIETVRRMKELAAKLDEASRVYYQGAGEIMSNLEYDRLYDEYAQLEKETGIILAASPTRRVGYGVVSELAKERHREPMLSLDKTKEVGVLADWLGKNKALLSWKLDGLTVVLTYSGGRLIKAVTRGNGEVGEVITQNAETFKNLPLKIPFEGELVLRGEAVISYADFEKINGQMGETEARYKNPRNLCSGSVRQLDSAVTAKRNVRFIAFSLVSAEGVDFENSSARQFEWMAGQGFEVVDHMMTDAAGIAGAVEEYRARAADCPLPTDGLVLLLEDIALGQGLGRTAKFPRNSIAFKWKDELVETKLVGIDWNASRTGLINPVATFEPVEIEGTTVRRASLHNVSIVKELELGIGDTVTVYKANMIIPQIAENLTRSGNIEVPEFCPVCGARTRLGSLSAKDGDGIKALYCDNADCQAKKIKSFALMAERDALNIEGLSESTLEKLIARGYIHTYSDLFRLQEHENGMAEMEGFGEKSAKKLVQAAEKARETSIEHVLYGLGIPGVGMSAARLICGWFGGDWKKLCLATEEELTQIDGIGEVTAKSFVEYFADGKNMAEFENLAGLLKLKKAETGTDLAGMSFVITGSLFKFKNRAELEEQIRARGGKTGQSVSAKTSFLINNDVGSQSAKNKKAKALGVKIISEEEFAERFL